MPSSTFLSFCRYFPLQKEKQAVPPPRPPPPLQTMLCCCPAACIRETTTESTLVMVGGMGPDCFSNCSLFDDCASHEFCRRLTVRCCNFTILLIQAFLSLLLAIKHSMLFALFIMVFGMVRDIFFIPSFQKGFFVQF